MQHERGLHLVQDNAFTTDEALVTAMIARSPLAWRAFQARYDRLVFGCIGKVTRRFSALVAQDDVREIAGTLYVALLANDMRKLRGFDPTRGTALSTWVGMLATHAAYDHLRRLRREPGKEQLDEVLELASDTPDPFEEASGQQRALLAEKTLEDLSAKDRAFVSLYFEEGMSAEAVAAELKISVKTVYSKKHKIQAKLASFISRAELAAA